MENIKSYIFKIWDVYRIKKRFVTVKASDDIYTEVVLKGSEKLNVNGVSLVVERDGTRLENDEELLFVKDEPIILLESNQIWMPEDSARSISTATTETVSSKSSVSDIPVDCFNEDMNQIAQGIPLVIVDNNSEIFWQQFDIWASSPQKLIAELEKGTRLSRLTNEVVRNVVDSMREIKTNLPSKAFKIVASRMVQKYEASFQSHDEDNVVLGNGYEALYTKLLDRNNYLNRPNKRKYATESPIPSKKNKLIANTRVGCPNWQPPLEQPTGTSDDDKIIVLRSLSEDDPKFVEILKETFPHQRQYINNDTHTINDVFEEWPGLFTEKGIFTHFQMLTKINIRDISIIEKSRRIKQFGENDKRTTLPEENDIIMCALKIVANYFKEDISNVIYEVAIMDEVQNNNNLVKIPAPCIIRVDKENLIEIEKKRIGPFISFENTFLMAFALYFNFNLCYPKQCACTFEFIQRYIFKIHQETGSKALTKNVKNKVLNFIRKLAG